MTIFVNEQQKEIEENTTLVLLIEQLKLPSSGIALSVNETVVPKSKWNDHILLNNDKILIITASQGG